MGPGLSFVRRLGPLVPLSHCATHRRRCCPLLPMAMTSYALPPQTCCLFSLYPFPFPISCPRLDDKIKALDEQLARFKDQIKKTRPGPAQDGIKRRALQVRRGQARAYVREGGGGLPPPLGPGQGRGNRAGAGGLVGSFWPRFALWGKGHNDERGPAQGEGRGGAWASWVRARGHRGPFGHVLVWWRWRSSAVKGLPPFFAVHLCPTCTRDALFVCGGGGLGGTRRSYPCCEVSAAVCRPNRTIGLGLPCAAACAMTSHCNTHFWTAVPPFTARVPLMYRPCFYRRF